MFFGDGGRMVSAVVRLDSQADGLLWFDGKNEKFFFFFFFGLMVAGWLSTVIWVLTDGSVMGGKGK